MILPGKFSFYQDLIGEAVSVKPEPPSQYTTLIKHQNYSQAA